MGTETYAIGNATVFRDDVLTHRWYDAFGPGVAKYVQDFVTWPDDDTTGDPLGFTLNITEAGGGDSTAVITANGTGGQLLITTAANEDDGYQMQITGEAFQLEGNFPCYFGIRFQVNDADQTDVLFGLCITDNDCLGGVTDGLYFRSPDESAVLSAVAEQDSGESTSAVATLTDAAWVTAEWLFDGDEVVFYINGVEVASLAATDANFPDDEDMTLTMELLTGEAVANTCNIDWVRVIQCRE